MAFLNGNWNSVRHGEDFRPTRRAPGRRDIGAGGKRAAAPPAAGDGDSPVGRRSRAVARRARRGVPSGAGTQVAAVGCGGHPDRVGPQRAGGYGRWQYLPVGAGPRACIGENVAMVEATLAVAAIARRIEIRSADSYFPVNPGLTAVVTAPIRARVRQRTPGYPRS